jgi:hypothetical protein
MPSIFIQLTNDLTIKMTVGEWLNVQHQIKRSLTGYYGRSRAAHHEPIRLVQMGLFDDILDKIEALLPGSGEVKFHFVLEEGAMPEQKGAAAALNDIGFMDEGAIPGLSKRLGLRCEILDSEGDILRVYFPDGTITGAIDK